MFCARIESHQLPSCKDTLRKHILRANFQAYIWRTCFEFYPATSNPENHGWKQNNDSLVFDWMEGAPAPKAVLEFLSCNCRRTCSPSNCACILNGLKCTDMCRLAECTNRENEDNVENECESEASDFEVDDEEIYDEICD